VSQDCPQCTVKTKNHLSRTGRDSNQTSIKPYFHTNPFCLQVSTIISEMPETSVFIDQDCTVSQLRKRYSGHYELSLTTERPCFTLLHSVLCYTYLDVKNLFLLYAHMFGLDNARPHKVLRANRVEVMAVRYCGQIREVLKKDFTQS